jgi:hypothetical protein
MYCLGWWAASSRSNHRPAPVVNIKRVATSAFGRWYAWLTAANATSAFTRSG